MSKRFSIAIQNHIKKVKGRGKLVFQKLSLEVDKGLVLSTPVDTGRARGGWNAGLNSVNMQETEADPQGAETLAKNEKVIRKGDMGDKLYLSNNVDYIEFLDQGSSEQAPNGMVDKTLQRFPQLIKVSVDESKKEMP